MPESSKALDSEEWDSWISHFEDCAVINGWSNKQKEQFLIICMGGAALLQLVMYNVYILVANFKVCQRACRKIMRQSKRHFTKNLYQSGSSYTRLNSEPDIASGTKSCQILPVRREDLSAEPIWRQCLICKIVNLSMCWRIEKYV